MFLTTALFPNMEFFTSEKDGAVMKNEHEKSRPMLAHGSGGSSVSGCVASASDGSSSITNTHGITTLDRLQDEIDTKFTPKKADTFLLSDVYGKLSLDGRAARVSDCGTFLEYLVNDTEKKLHAANFCRDRLCPMCNWRRSLKIFGQMSKIMDFLQQEGYRFLFLTLTVKNCPAEKLPETVNALFAGWRYLYHKNKIFRSLICGTYRGLEVTRNSNTGEFHPHLHCILAVRPDYFKGGNYITQAQWSKLWQSACALDYDPIVHIQTVKAGARGLGGAVAEVAKYAVKSSDYLSGSMDDKLAYVSAFLSALTRRKLVSLTGCFRKAGKLLNLDDMEAGDLIHIDDDSIREDLQYMIVRYGWRNGIYVRLS